MRPPTPRSEGLPARLQYLADLAGSVTALASAANLSRKTLQDWLLEKRPASNTGLLRIVAALGISEEWLINGTGDPPIAFGHQPGDSSSKVELVDFADPGVKSFVSVTGTWLQWRHNLKPENVLWYHMPDLSMYPDIGVGEPVLVNKALKGPGFPVQGSVLLLVRYRDEYLLRYAKFQFTRGRLNGSVLLRAFNQQFPEILATPNELEVLGHVVWWGRSVDNFLGTRAKGANPDLGPYVEA